MAAELGRVAAGTGHQRPLAWAECNSNVGGHFLNIISSTIGTNVGEVLNFPVLKKSEDEVEQISEQNIKVSRYDWDSYEISRDFKRNPLV